MLKTPTEPRAAKLSVVTIFAICSVVWPAFASAQEQQPKKESPLSPSARTRIRKAVASVGLVLIRNHGDPAGQNPRPRGSAVVVRADGIVVTNAHVILDSKTGRLYDEIFLSFSADGSPQSKRYRLKELTTDRADDLALLRIESGASAKELVFPALEIGDSQNIRLLDDIVIIGYPEKGGSSVTVNRGTVEGKDELGRWIKTDARLTQGNSGGAAVSLDGKLIGIPTKVIARDQPLDKNREGLSDDDRRYGAVGFLRPAHMVARMLAGASQVADIKASTVKPSTPDIKASTVKPSTPDDSALTFLVRGKVRSASNGKPIAGAVVGLVRAGQEATEENLLSWGGTNPDGQFKLNKPLPPGRYTLRAKALGYLPYLRNIEIAGNGLELRIEMHPSSGQ